MRGSHDPVSSTGLIQPADVLRHPGHQGRRRWRRRKRARRQPLITVLARRGDGPCRATAKKDEVAYWDLYDLTTDGLEGQTADAEAKARRILADDAMDLWTGIKHSGNDLIDASTSVDNLKNKAWELRGRIVADDLSVAAGAVCPAMINGDTDTYKKIYDYQVEVDHLVEQADDIVQFLQGVYDDIAGLDDTALGPRPEVVNVGVQQPDSSWTTEEVNDWWTSLSEDEQNDIIANNPDWIGNLNGVSLAARSEANKNRLDAMKAEIDRQVKDFEPKTELQWTGYKFEYKNTSGYEAMLQRQKDIDSLRDTFSYSENPDKERIHSLLVLDNSGDHLRAAVGTGDIDAADHVLVYTPGMTTTVAGGLVTGGKEFGAKVDEVERIMSETGMPDHDDKNTEQVEETAAGVTWLGYDAPGWDETLTGSDGTVLSDHEAQSAAPDLAGFYDGIQATHTGDPHLVAAGHSYGSTVTGYASQESDAPDDIVVWGSPGASTVDASDLNTVPDRMYSASATDDFVAGYGRYGGNPTTDPESDFTPLDTRGHYEDGLQASAGHSLYTKAGTTSLHNLGNILADNEPDYPAPED